jgi:hypothetical protein
MTQNALNALDGRTAQKAFLPTNVKAASEYEEQVIVINAVLAPGGGKPPHPATVKPEQDHIARIKANAEWMISMTQLQIPVEPMSRQAIMDNTKAHYEMLKQINPDAIAQVDQMILQIEQQAMQPPTVASAPPQI